MLLKEKTECLLPYYCHPPFEPIVAAPSLFHIKTQALFRPGTRRRTHTHTRTQFSCSTINVTMETSSLGWVDRHQHYSWRVTWKQGWVVFVGTSLHVDPWNLEIRWGVSCWIFNGHVVFHWWSWWEGLAASCALCGWAGIWRGLGLQCNCWENL